MRKREYPLFIIDTSKRDGYPFDCLVCLDRTVGFVARVFQFWQDEPLRDFVEKSKKNPHFEFLTLMYRFSGGGGVILVIEDFLYHFEFNYENKNRVKSLLKKLIKKYIYTEKDRTPREELTLENQIKQQKINIENARENYDEILHRTNVDVKIVDYQIALAEETLKSLEQLRDIQTKISSPHFKQNFNINNNPFNNE
ncbi:MAG: hypothetical protein LBS69_04030 [Prevotellaceae bacterium]|jgi:hypothetical protein|nr:hypothetical protein [Prevotellaceae bacterium]